MDIAALSIGVSQASIASQASLAVMKMVMEQAEMQNHEFMKLSEQTVNPNKGGNIDIKL